MTDVLLSGFADEAAPDKTTDQQFATMAALGLRYLTMRFVDVGKGVQNVLALDDSGFETVRNQLDAYGLNVSSIGSPIGKVKIADFEDGTDNRFVPFKEYLESDVRAAIAAAERLQTKLIRGFSFYHPRDTDHGLYLNQVVQQIGKIVEVCDGHGLTFGLEVEANLVGHTGFILQEIYQQINHPALMLIFDGANLVTQGFTPTQIFEQFQAMLGGLGWMHVKDYLSSEAATQKPGHYVDEEALNRYVPADRGSAGHAALFCELLAHLPEIRKKLERRGLPGFFLDLEPHLRGGGQFGGFSGPDGMGIALRSLCDVLNRSGLEYTLKNFGDMQAKQKPA